MLEQKTKASAAVVFQLIVLLVLSNACFCLFFKLAKRLNQILSGGGSGGFCFVRYRLPANTSVLQLKMTTEHCLWNIFCRQHEKHLSEVNR